MFPQCLLPSFATWVYVSPVKQKHILLLETMHLVWQNWETLGKHVSAANVSVATCFIVLPPRALFYIFSRKHHPIRYTSQISVELHIIAEYSSKRESTNTKDSLILREETSKLMVGEDKSIFYMLITLGTKSWNN